MISSVVLSLALIAVASAAPPGIFQWNLKQELHAHDRIQIHFDTPAVIGKDYRIIIDLAKDDKDTVFHFNPRFARQYTVCNTKKNGKWGTEQLTKENFPFKAGQSYRVDIQAEDDAFQVYVNGIPYLKYVNRMKPLSNTKYIAIKHVIPKMLFVESRTY